MGAAARAAERAGKAHCDGCGKPWTEVRIASFGGSCPPIFDIGPPTPDHALCRDCDFLESTRRRAALARGSKSGSR